MKNTAIAIHFNRLETSNEEAQRIYDYIIQLGWSNLAKGYRGETGNLSYCVFCWNLSHPPVFPEGIEYELVNDTF